MIRQDLDTAPKHLWGDWFLTISYYAFGIVLPLVRMLVISTWFSMQATASPLVPTLLYELLCGRLPFWDSVAGCSPKDIQQGILDLIVWHVFSPTARMA